MASSCPQDGKGALPDGDVSREPWWQDPTTDRSPEAAEPLPHQPRQSPEETLLYSALVARADELSPYENLAVLPQPCVIARGRRFRPDLLVVKNSTLAVEVDDPTHFARRAADRSKDALLEDCGIPVLRIVLDDLFDPAVVEDWVDRIVARVHRYRPR